MEQDKKRVVAYCRVSTKSDDQANSFENQERFFKREIKKNPNYIQAFPNDDYIYSDKGLTGTKLHREAFSRMIRDAGLEMDGVNLDKGCKIIGKPKFDIILVKNTARFARNLTAVVILRSLAKNNVHVYFLDREMNTEKNMEDIETALSRAAGESRAKRNAVMWGNEEGALNGMVRVNGRIYGFKYTPKPENSLRAIPQEADVVRMIFDMYSKGYGARVIRNTLTSKGIYTREHKEFNESKILRMIKNEKYAGYNNPLRFSTGDDLYNKHRQRLKDTYKCEKSDKIDQIVSDEVFDKCQELLKNKINHKNQKGINEKSKSKFGDILVCGKCRKKYHSNTDHLPNGTRRTYYNCSTKKKYGNKACDNINISEKALIKQLEKKAMLYKPNREIMIETFIMSLKRKKYYYINSLDSNNIEEINAIDEKIQSKYAELENNQIAINKGGARKKVAEKLADEIANEIEDLENHKNDLLMNQNEVIIIIEKIDNDIKEAKATEIKEEYSLADYLQDIVEIKVVEKNNKATIEPVNRFMRTIYDDTMENYEYIKNYSFSELQEKELDKKYNTILKQLSARKNIDIIPNK